MKKTMYSLKKKIITKNSIGQKVESLEFVADILVSISTNLYTTVTGDNIYRKYAATGITTYKNLSIRDSYIITDGNHSYNIESFNVDSRFTQLLLKEVVL